MPDVIYERSYGSTRFVFGLLGLLAWFVVLAGLLTTAFGALAGGSIGQIAATGVVARIIGALPGLGIMILGLGAVAFAQLGRVHIDTAETNREMLALAREEAYEEPPPRRQASRPAQGGYAFETRPDAPLRPRRP